MYVTPIVLEWNWYTAAWAWQFN